MGLTSRTGREHASVAATGSAPPPCRQFVSRRIPGATERRTTPPSNIETGTNDVATSGARFRGAGRHPPYVSAPGEVTLSVIVGGCSAPAGGTTALRTTKSCLAPIAATSSFESARGGSPGGVPIFRKKESRPVSRFGTVAKTMTSGSVAVFLTECQAPGGTYQVVPGRIGTSTRTPSSRRLTAPSPEIRYPNSSLRSCRCSQLRRETPSPQLRPVAA